MNKCLSSVFSGGYFLLWLRVMRFQKYPFSSRRKRSKIFLSTLAFLYRFHLSTLKRSKTMKRRGPGIAHVLTIIHLRYMLRFGLEPMACDCFLHHRFHLSTLETKRFQKSPLLKPFPKVSVFVSVFGRFNVDVRRKRIKTCAFSNENVSVDGA